MPNRLLTFVVLVLVVVVGLMATGNIGNTIQATTQESTFDRVTRTGTLRCAYATWAPGFYVDAATGEKKGFSVEVAEALAKRLGLKIEWAEETGWGTAEQGFTTNRYDAMCAHVCSDSIRGRAAYFARPFLIEPVVAMVRADDTRFDAAPSLINSPDVSVGIMRGGIFEYTARDYAPRAKQIDLNELGTQMDMFLSLTTKKIDVAFNTGISAKLYNEKNPNTIKVIGKPLRYCNAGFLLPVGDDRLKHFIDGGFDELLANGTIREIMGRYYGPNSPNWQEPQISMPADQPLAREVK